MSGSHYFPIRLDGPTSITFSFIMLHSLYIYVQIIANANVLVKYINLYIIFIHLIHKFLGTKRDVYMGIHKTAHKMLQLQFGLVLDLYFS